MLSSGTSWRLLNSLSHQLHIFKWPYVSSSSMSSCLHATSFFQLLNPHSNCVSIRNSVIAWNNEPSPKSSFCHNHRFVVLNTPSQKILQISCPNLKDYWIGVNDRSKQDHPHHSPNATPSKLLSPFCLVFILICIGLIYWTTLDKQLIYWILEGIKTLVIQTKTLRKILFRPKQWNSIKILIDKFINCSLEGVALNTLKA